jgi:hypothetical protein
MKRKTIYSILVLFTMLLNACGDKKSTASTTDANTAAIQQEVSRKLQAHEDSMQEVLREKDEQLDKQLKKEEDRLEREEIVELAKLNQNFPPYCEVVVAVQKSFFYDSPNRNKITRKYLVSGDECTIIKTHNGFGYTEFYNSTYDKTSVGWIDLHDVEYLSGGADY